ncbi:hypothetical protein U6G28_01570 [Actinomycetaceae bacterium MB13-C1-2]|nr:hypothetical protein U6G28_01570 [Actinomycetaceae bacterium MB13-C1-2]
MALFELENGRLVPAQFGHDVPDGFTDEVLEAIKSQVLEIVSRPLFPIAWSTEEHASNAECSRLTGLDASGQVVAVEVMRRLDADILIDSLSRLSDTASLSWADLARTYPMGPDGFRREWVSFREAMPPSPPNGPRLILVTSEIAEEIRPALDVLSSSGVEVHQMSLRQMANGRAFLDVDVVGPRVYGHRANTLLETSAVLPVIEAGVEAEEAPSQAHGRHSGDAAVHELHETPEVKTPAPLAVPPTALPTRRSLRSQRRTEQRHPFRLSGPVVQSHASTDETSHLPSRVERHHSTAAEEPVPSDISDLALIAHAAGGDVTLYLRAEQRTPEGAKLTAEGLVSVPSGHYDDPTDALQAEGIWAADGWSAWRLASSEGPTLADALEEIRQWS